MCAAFDTDDGRLADTGAFGEVDLGQGLAQSQLRKRLSNF